MRRVRHFRLYSNKDQRSFCSLVFHRLVIQIVAPSALFLFLHTYLLNLFRLVEARPTLSQFQSLKIKRWENFANNRNVMRRILKLSSRMSGGDSSNGPTIILFFSICVSSAYAVFWRRKKLFWLLRWILASCKTKLATVATDWSVRETEKTRLFGRRFFPGWRIETLLLLLPPIRGTYNGDTMHSVAKDDST